MHNKWSYVNRCVFSAHLNVCVFFVDLSAGVRLFQYDGATRRNDLDGRFLASFMQTALMR